MDFIDFISNQELEVTEKAGLYCVMQSNIPKHLQAFRCGLAGKPVDSATQFKSSEGSFKSRFSQYLNYWRPERNAAKVFAVLTVPRKSIMGFAERVMPEQQEGDNREPYQLLHMGKTLIEIRERQYHQLLVKYGMSRLGMPGTEESRKRGEFFRGPLETCIKALKGIGTGDLYLFKDNNEVEKITLKKRGVTINPDQVALRSSPRFNAAEDLINQMLTDAPTQRAVAKLAQIRPVATPETTTRRSPRLEGLDIIIDGTELDALRKNPKRAVATVQQLARIRRSPRLQNI